MTDAAVPRDSLLGEMLRKCRLQGGQSRTVTVGQFLTIGQRGLFGLGKQLL